MAEQHCSAVGIRSVDAFDTLRFAFAKLHLKAMPVYKLAYFNGRCKAELARMMFVFQGQDFEDIRLTEDEWPEYKKKAPFGQVPTLDIDGKVYSESVAINNHLARQFGLYGQTDVQKFEIDQVVGITQDIWRYIIDDMYEVFEKNTLSYADLAVFDVLDIQFPESLIDKYPLVKANRDMAKNNRYDKL